MTTKGFWDEVRRLQKEHRADNILVYMHLMLQRARSAHAPVTYKAICDYGKTVKLFTGVETWFQRINNYARKRHVNVEHFIISSGLREMIEHTAIGKEFKEIFASSFMYNENGVAEWPALALNYTTKTQYLFRINKGNLDVFDHSKINDYIPHSDRPVPFTNMIFIGDGETDIPCFRLVKDHLGHSIAVYHPRRRGAKAKAEKLIRQGRVNFAAPANFSEDKKLDQLVRAIIDKVAVDDALHAHKHKS